MSILAWTAHTDRRFWPRAGRHELKRRDGWTLVVDVDTEDGWAMAAIAADDQARAERLARLLRRVGRRGLENGAG